MTNRKIAAVYGVVDLFEGKFEQDRTIE